MDPSEANPVAHLQDTWHLRWQAAEGQSLLPNAAMAVRIRNRLIAAHQKRGRVLIDYLVLPTEIHLVSRLGTDDTPGRLAGAIGNFVSRWVREIRRTQTPVMGGPFRASNLSSLDAARLELRMLAWRPVRQGLCRGPTFYPHGALRIALGLSRPDGFDARPMLRHFGRDTIEARHALARWIAQRPSELQWRSWELARGLVLAPHFGGPEPMGFRPVKTPEAAAFIAMAGEGGVEGSLDLLARWVMGRLGVTVVGDLRQGADRRSVRTRAIVTRIAVLHGLCSSAFVARYFGRAKATISEQVAASRLRREDSDIVSTPIGRIVEDLTNGDGMGAAGARRGAGRVRRS